jgi:hypothetical protein
MITLRSALVIACIAVCIPVRGELSAKQSVGGGQKNAVAMARQAVSSAQQMQAAGDFDGARRLLSEAINNCSLDPGNTRECRGRINYGLGYVTQLQATSSDAQAEALANDALRSYRAVLADFPAHAEALRNIWVLYSTLGGAKLEPEQLRKAAAEDPARRSAYVTLLGDHFASKADVAAARAAFRDAIQAAPADPNPRRRLLQSYDVTKAQQGDTVLSQLANLEATFPDLAADGYLELLDNANADVDQGQALIRWVSLQAARGQSPQSFVDDLPPRVLGTKAGVDLSNYIKEPWTPPAPNNWWFRNDGARVALARVGLRIGEQMLAVEKPARVEKCWSTALAFTRPTESVTLDLQRSLALLYDGHRDLDPAGDRFGAVEQRMFESKGEAIAKHNLLSEQRYHATLGIIYAQRGQWRSNSYAHDALYQLNAARLTASQRDVEDGTYQPLPLIKELLANAYAFANDADNRRAALLSAARAYLDLDDVARAATLLDSTRLTGDDADVLRRLIRVRTPARATGVRCDLEASRIPDLLASDAGFAARQAFKVAADCALSRNAVVELRTAQLALTTALSPGFALVGAGDILRFEQVRALVLKQARMTAPDLQLQRGAPRRVTDARGVPIAVSLDDESAFILLPVTELDLARRTR